MNRKLILADKISSGRLKHLSMCPAMSKLLDAVANRPRQEVMDIVTSLNARRRGLLDLLFLESVSAVDIAATFEIKLPLISDSSSKTFKTDEVFNNISSAVIREIDKLDHFIEVFLAKLSEFSIPIGFSHKVKYLLSEFGSNQIFHAAGEQKDVSAIYGIVGTKITGAVESGITLDFLFLDNGEGFNIRSEYQNLLGKSNHDIKLQPVLAQEHGRSTIINYGMHSSDKDVLYILSNNSMIDFTYPLIDSTDVLNGVFLDHHFPKGTLVFRRIFLSLEELK